MNIKLIYIFQGILLKISVRKVDTVLIINLFTKYNEQEMLCHGSF